MAGNPSNNVVFTISSPAKHAFLIASPWRDLKGPLHDVNAMSQLLQQHGFSVMKLLGEQATKANILQDWRAFISRLGKHDTALVYYSGHGGLLEIDSSADIPSKRYQFLVPHDYNPDDIDKFRGILDVEISLLLNQTTERTENVTMILDCCHSGRMARDPGHVGSAVPKSVERFQVKPTSAIAEMIAKMHDVGQHAREHLLQYPSLEGNSHAVRLVAAADNERAYEFDDRAGQRMGAMTKALIPSLKDALSVGQPISSDDHTPEDICEEYGVSWESVAMRVGQIVNAEFPDQHPHIEGPHQRVVFSRRTKQTKAVLVTRDGDELILHGGLIAGITKKDRYVIMPPGHQRIEKTKQLGEARVLSVSGFRAVIRPDSEFRVPAGGALAFIKTRATPQWPVEVPKELRDHRLIAESKFIRPVDESDADMAVARIISQHGHISLCDRGNIELGQWDFQTAEEHDDAIEDAIVIADGLGRAKHLLTLRSPPEERLNHSLEFSVEPISQSPTISNDGNGVVKCGDRVVVNLHNSGDKEIFVSVFNINVLGNIILTSRGSPNGIRLPAGGSYQLGKTQFVGSKVGLGMSWPQKLAPSSLLKVPESFLFVVSDAVADLRYFANVTRDTPLGETPSQLESLAYTLAHGLDRDCEVERVRKDIKWDVSRFAFALART